MADRICSIPDCGRPFKSRGWCRRHYDRWQRHGDPTAGYRSPGAPLPPCSVEGCVQPTGKIIKGMCVMHYSRSVTTGEVGPAQSHRIIGDVDARFWSYVDREGPLPPHRFTLGWCWQWTGTLGRQGYGSFYAEGRSWQPHRWAFHRFVGPIPDGHEIDHLCHNRGCVNFERHLEPVLKSEHNRRRLVVAPEYGWASL